MDTTISPLQQLINECESHGMTEEQIGKVCNEVVEEATKTFLQEMFASLTEEDTGAIDAITDKKLAEDEAVRRYEMRTGGHAKERLKLLIDQMAKTRLAKKEDSPSN